MLNKPLERGQKSRNSKLRVLFEKLLATGIVEVRDDKVQDRENWGWIWFYKAVWDKIELLFQLHVILIPTPIDASNTTWTLDKISRLAWQILNKVTNTEYV